MTTNEVTKLGARKRTVEAPAAPAGTAFVRLADEYGAGAAQVRVAVSADAAGGIRTAPLGLPEYRPADDAGVGGWFVRVGEGRLYYYARKGGGGWWFVVRDGAVRAVRDQHAAAVLTRPPARPAKAAPAPAPAPARKRYVLGTIAAMVPSPKRKRKGG